jgi:hypothetical protein
MSVFLKSFSGRIALVNLKAGFLTTTNLPDLFALVLNKFLQTVVFFLMI